jgi:sulfide:quinone oxidoreductase
MPAPRDLNGDRRLRVVIAGGGIGAIETVLALRALAGDRVDLELVAPGKDFVFRPLAVAEPFGHAAPLRFPLAELAESHGVRVRRDAVAAVDAAARRCRLRGGSEIPYDALVVAVGGGREPWLPGAMTFAGTPEDVREYRALLAGLRRGDVDRLLFAVPVAASWTLPVYELALLTAAWCAEEGVIGAQLALATPEEEPLRAFGPAAARALRDLMSDRGIELLTATTVRNAERDPVRLDRGRTLGADRTVTLPRLRAVRVEGLPADGEGFVPVDEHAAVTGLRNVYAVGDTTSFPIKQGGLATQQADAAATAIAAAAGAPVAPEPFAPVMRGLLLTGITSAYLRVELYAPEQSSRLDWDSLWWPATKVAGRYLAPYLAGKAGMWVTPPEPDRAAVSAAAPASSAGAPEQTRALALELAERDLALGDRRSAMHWAQTVEWLDGRRAPEVEGLLRRCECDAPARFR